MCKNTSKHKQAALELSLLKSHDEKKRKPKGLDQKSVHSGSSCTNTKGHDLVKICKGNIIQQNEVKCLQTSNEVVKFGEINMFVYLLSLF